MPLTDEEWRAFINEYNGTINDVEADLATLLETVRLGLRNLATRGEVPDLEAEAIWLTIREPPPSPNRLNAHGRNLIRLREAGEM